MIDAIQETGLFMLNKEGQPPTYTRSDGSESNIDFMLANAKSLPDIANWKVHKHLTTSDHSAIPPHRESNKTEKCLLLHKADWEKH